VTYIAGSILVAIAAAKTIICLVTDLSTVTVFLPLTVGPPQVSNGGTKLFYVYKMRWFSIWQRLYLILAIARNSENLLLKRTSAATPKKKRPFAIFLSQIGLKYTELSTPWTYSISAGSSNYRASSDTALLNPIDRLQALCLELDSGVPSTETVATNLEDASSA
jgi:hypothetical protein